MPKSAVLRRSTDAKSKLLAKYRTSGLTQEAFCRTEKVPPSTLQNWLRKAKAQEAPPFTELPVARMPAGASVEITFPDGTVLKIGCR